MGMLGAYFDDSGTDQANRTAVVAGYIGTDFQWKRFVAKWKSALDGEGVRILQRSALENFKGEFTEARGWNPERRTRFVKKLHAIIKACTYTPIAAAVVKSDFENIAPVWAKRLFGGPYGWCAFMCIAVRGWRLEHRDPGPIDWIFESGTAGSREVDEMFQALQTYAEIREAYSVNSYVFSDKSVKPLQAADIIAYEVFKQVENQILDGGTRKVRFSILDLLPKVEGNRYMTIGTGIDCDSGFPTARKNDRSGPSHWRKLPRH